MKRVKSGTKISIKFAENKQVVIFLSNYLTDAKIWYENFEYEYLAVVKYLTEIKWPLINNFYEIFIYLNHHILQDIFSKGDSEKAKINAWLDQFSKFDLQLVNWLLRDQHIGLANGLS